MERARPDDPAAARADETFPLSGEGAPPRWKSGRRNPRGTPHCKGGHSAEGRFVGSAFFLCYFKKINMFGGRLAVLTSFNLSSGGFSGRVTADDRHEPSATVRDSHEVNKAVVVDCH